MSARVNALAAAWVFDPDVEAVVAEFARTGDAAAAAALMDSYSGPVPGLPDVFSVLLALRDREAQVACILRLSAVRHKRPVIAALINAWTTVESAIDEKLIYTIAQLVVR